MACCANPRGAHAIAWADRPAPPPPVPADPAARAVDTAKALVDAKQAHVAELEANYTALLAGEAKDKAAAELTREHAELARLKDRERSASLVSWLLSVAWAAQVRTFGDQAAQAQALKLSLFTRPHVNGAGR